MSFVIPGSAGPNNLHYGPKVKASLVESDLFNICERIKEVDPRLFIILLEEDDRAAYAIMERCDDGVERLVCKCRELDQRIIDKLMYLRSVPFEHRFKEVTAQIDREEEEEKERQSEELYERLGAPMLRELERTNFIDRKRKAVLPISTKISARHRNEHSKLKLG